MLVLGVRSRQPLLDYGEEQDDDGEHQGKGRAAAAIPLVQRVEAAPGAQLHHKRNVVVVYGLLGQADHIKASPPTGLSTKEINTLLARAKSIRAKGSTQAKAKALGSIVG